MSLTPEHWEAIGMRADGATYATIALEQDCSVEVAKQRVQQTLRVLELRVNDQTEEHHGEDDGS